MQCPGHRSHLLPPSNSSNPATKEASLITCNADCGVQVVIRSQDQPRIVIEGRAEPHIDALSGARVQLGVLHKFAAAVDNRVTGKGAKARKVGVMEGQGISFSPFTVRSPTAAGVRHHVCNGTRVVHCIAPEGLVRLVMGS